MITSIAGQSFNDLSFQTLLPGTICAQRFNPLFDFRQCGPANENEQRTPGACIVCAGTAQKETAMATMTSKTSRKATE
jgi:hypothetical protein